MARYCSTMAWAITVRYDEYRRYVLVHFVYGIVLDAVKQIHLLIEIDDGSHWGHAKYAKISVYQFFGGSVDNSDGCHPYRVYCCVCDINQPHCMA